jgi:hypothetical protein
MEETKAVSSQSDARASSLENKASGSSCESVPSLYAVLTREAQCQALIDDAYARQEEALRAAADQAPGLARGDMDGARKRADLIREDIDKATAKTLAEIKTASTEQCKKLSDSRGTLNEDAHGFVIGLVTGISEEPASAGLA